MHQSNLNNIFEHQHGFELHVDLQEHIFKDIISVKAGNLLTDATGNSFP